MTYDQGVKIYNAIMIGYFVVLFAVMNWKGSAFLSLPFGERILIGGACFLPLVAWVVIGHLASSTKEE